MEKYKLLLPIYNEGDEIKANKKILENKDEYQVKAIECPLGNTSVTACAGSGKTTVLIGRVANLLDNGADPYDMLILTFTNKAANEIKTRIVNFIGEEKGGSIKSGTFHSVAGKFIREFSPDYCDYNIASAEKAIKIITRLRREEFSKYGKPLKEFPTAYVIMGIGSGAFNHDISVLDYMYEYSNNKIMMYKDDILNILKKYEEYKKEMKLMDFDDMLKYFEETLNNDDIRRQIVKNTKHIFVDEYQDTNPIQNRILFKLNYYDNLFVIGDANQCIYQFRGSKPQFIMNFKKLFGGANEYFLRKNYRSVPEVLKLAEESINNNFRYDTENHVEIVPHADKGVKPKLYRVYNSEEVAEHVARDIRDNHMDNLDECAVLCRRNAETAAFERIFKALKIPYEVVGSLGFFDRAHIKDMVSLVESIEIHDRDSFERLLVIFPGIGEVKALNIYNFLEENRFNYKDAIARSTNKDHIHVMKILQEAERLYKNVSIAESLEFFYDTIYRDVLKMKENYEEKEGDIIEFVNMAHKFPSPSEFMVNITIESEVDTQGAKKSQSVTPMVKVMSMHKSKGLEWDNVYIPNLDKNVFPMEMDGKYIKNGQNIKDERNLFYVAVTRARKNLHLYTTIEKTFSQNPYNRSTETTPSPFLLEVLMNKNKFEDSPIDMDKNLFAAIVNADFPL